MFFVLIGMMTPESRADFKIPAGSFDLCVSTENWPLATPPPTLKKKITHKTLRAIHLALSPELEAWALLDIGVPIQPDLFLKKTAVRLKWLQNQKALGATTWTEFQGFESKQKRADHHWKNPKGHPFTSWSWILDNTNVAIVVKFNDKEEASAQKILEYYFKGHLSLSCEK
jgi:hypothetical protein